VGLDEFCVGPFCTHREGEELIVEIAVSPIPQGSGAYVWVPKRTAVDETLVGVSVWLLGDPVQKTCLGAAVALSSVAPVPLRCKKTESFLQGKILNRETFRQAGEVAAAEASPRSRADYRRTLVSILTEEALAEAWRRSPS
jgi:carbon-monoxide dehydrogenase medium subunit